MAAFGMRILEEVVDAPGVERRRAANDPVHLVALVEQELGEVGAVLAGDAGDERPLHTATACWALYQS